jgi:hypothetical protein
VDCLEPRQDERITSGGRIIHRGTALAARWGT